MLRAPCEKPMSRDRSLHDADWSGAAQWRINDMAVFFKVL
jgi:hypothetical protein